MGEDNRKDIDIALDHLGDVLLFLAELSPNDRCKALDDALEFYNNARPEAKVQPEPGYISRLVHVGPLDWPFYEKTSLK